MTSIQNQFNQLLLDKAKLAETERANKAHEAIQSRQAAASEQQAQAATRQAGVAENKFKFGKEGPIGVLNEFLGSILKALRS